MAVDLPPGFAGFQQWVTTIHTAFPDIHYTIEDMIAADDKVVTRVLVEGTHQDDFMGMSPTGRSFRITGINIDRFAGDKMVEHWAEYDMVTMMQQLGLVPPSL